jgi:hypothetical protein
MAKIAQKHGITRKTIYYWILINEQFCDAYLRALENRALVYGGEMLEDLGDLERYVQNEENDPRNMHARIQLFHRKSGAYQWLMTKYNRKVFGDKLDVDATVTVQPAEQRAQAWQIARKLQEAEYTEVPPPQGTDT